MRHNEVKRPFLTKTRTPVAPGNQKKIYQKVSKGPNKKNLAAESLELPKKAANASNYLTSTSKPPRLYGIIHNLF